MPARPPYPPIEPPPSHWRLQDAPDLAQDLLASGADLAPGTVLSAYRLGLFPMGIGPHGAEPLGWWSPLQRGVLTPGDHHVQRSLRRSARRFRVAVDTAFDDVVAVCADPSRDGRWITPAIAQAYRTLHELGWAHSVEVWDGAELAGGLYGVSIGGFFAGESMFHRRTDAGKVALWALAQAVLAHPAGLIDVQWQTDHLSTQGVREVSRQRYLELLAAALAAPVPALLRGSGSREIDADS
ncbi:leucyl/phenylalanyl-tRNA--protein transferase [Branchiibius hedensis]|uniref:Leucyl/phenylalanyl-tRNA--protein transferase n=1 Tax=Branchiibius hedensis TaxID=672460 RepID=A0A2Y9BT90_9MICO|nr:leucyl/phenylalanyl-tRNA--protein transferase [Branchiibius hedensis]PWJ24816.1 leucyl/phenylalanyl-tRNA--protein transferase [Branchiibius hedensis]SSA33632.1 leucyl/phenylalanyl-tRNA--protein transferase [Branchiibius hedensis]